MAFGKPKMTFAKAKNLPAKPKIRNCYKKSYKSEILLIHNKI
jgi:hypothetical protein